MAYAVPDLEEEAWADAVPDDLEEEEEEWAHAVPGMEEELPHALANLEEQEFAEAVPDLEDLESTANAVADLEEEPADAVSVALERRCNPFSIELYDIMILPVCARPHLQECLAVAPYILPPLHPPRHEHSQL